jgi:predicted nucleotidyltransferase
VLTNEQLNALIQRLLDALSLPAKVILFGSYARQEANEESDVDLLVLAPAFENKANTYLHLKSTLGRVGVGVDLVLMTLSDFEQRAQVPGTLPYWVQKEGKVCYDGLS